ncbi:MAG: response regulator [Candidatus Latescibacteria bacterium]|nr:response regulator [bacterium]MBD3423706.1 response regulator [Candidatus Latescibacterota bacterium]
MADLKSDNPRILVVDDEEHIRRILKYQLEKNGYSAVCAEDGKKGLLLAREMSPDLIILDLMMPMMDGFEVCTRLKDDFQTSHIPIIMLTARSEMGDKLKGLENGANDYLVKPYSNEELLLRVKNVLDWGQKQKDANPLTGFSGNKAIEKELSLLLDRSQSFAFLYIDIDNFKAYNDYYGYQKGDQSILFLADIIKETVESLGNKDDFIGHIGGDDFVVITSLEKADRVAKRIIDEFDKGSLVLMDEEDIRRGYLEIKDRLGRENRVPLMSLTVALVENGGESLKHFAQVSDIASELKKYGKKMRGSVLVRERRQSGVESDTMKT